MSVSSNSSRCSAHGNAKSVRYSMRWRPGPWCCAALLLLAGGAALATEPPAGPGDTFELITASGARVPLHLPGLAAFPSLDIAAACALVKQHNDRARALIKNP